MGLFPPPGPQEQESGDGNDLCAFQVQRVEGLWITPELCFVSNKLVS